MSNQPAPARPWFRLASIARSAPPQAPAPTPETAPAPQRQATIRPAFRPTGMGPEGTPAGGVASVPTSPVTGGRVSQPSSPDKRPAISSVPSSPVRTVANGGGQTTPPITVTTGSVPSSPIRPVATTFSVPTSPAKPVATTFSVPTSPAKPVATTYYVPTSPVKPVTSSLPTSPAKTTTSPPTQKIASPVPTTTRVAGPVASLTTVKPAAQSPIESPKIKPPTAPPPSPLTLPVSQFKIQSVIEPKIPPEAVQKTVLVQTKAEKPKPERLHPDQGETHKHGFPLLGKKEPFFKDGETKEKGNGKKYTSDSDDSSMRVITMAGENKGAFMELIQSPHKNGVGQRLREQKRSHLSRIGSDASDYQSYSSSEEGDRKMKDKNNTSDTMPMSAFMNSNVQGINNSIMYNSSCTHHDPGVHLSLLKKPAGGGFHVKERTNGYNS